MRRVAALGILCSALLGACASACGRVAVVEKTPREPADAIVEADRVVCPLLDTRNVQASFGLERTLRIVAMAEAHGPACNVRLAG